MPNYKIQSKYRALLSFFCVTINFPVLVSIPIVVMGINSTVDIECLLPLVLVICFCDLPGFSLF